MFTLARLVRMDPVGESGASLMVCLKPLDQIAQESSFC